MFASPIRDAFSTLFFYFARAQSRFFPSSSATYSPHSSFTRFGCYAGSNAYLLFQCVINQSLNNRVGGKDVRRMKVKKEKPDRSTWVRVKGLFLPLLMWYCNFLRLNIRIFYIRPTSRFHLRFHPLSSFFFLGSPSHIPIIGATDIIIMLAWGVSFHFANPLFPSSSRYGFSVQKENVTARAGSVNHRHIQQQKNEFFSAYNQSYTYIY